METFEIDEITLVIERYAHEGGASYTAYLDGEVIGRGQDLETCLQDARHDVYGELTRSAEWL